MPSAMIDVPVAIAMVIVTEIRRYRKSKNEIEKREQLVARLKTTAVGFKGKDGIIDLRGVKITLKNYRDVGSWLDDKGYAIVHIDKDGAESDQRVKVWSKQGIRVARVGDIVAIDRETKDWYVIKAADFEKYVKI